jgi:hypothetical protein
MTIQGVVLLAIGLLDIVIASLLGTSLSTPVRVNSGIFGLLVLILAVGLLRTRVFLSDTEIVVRNMWRSHRSTWSDVTGIVVAPRQVTLARADGTTVPCMALTPRVTRPGAQEAIDAIKAHIRPGL